MDLIQILKVEHCGFKSVLVNTHLSIKAFSLWSDCVLIVLHIIVSAWLDSAYKVSGTTAGQTEVKQKIFLNILCKILVYRKGKSVHGL